MNTLSDEQQRIVDAPLAPMSVIACAGSGKTRTAVYRIIEICRKLGEHRGRVALLSFSNVAVGTFQVDFSRAIKDVRSIHRHQVEIDTLDGFITTNILRPHGHRTMGCNRSPFLIVGTEPFLQNKEFKFWAQAASGKLFPAPPNKVTVNLQTGNPVFQYQNKNALLTINNGLKVTEQLGAVGAYTHNLARYWCYRILKEQPIILRALARRYPHILIDEAQDIGAVHQAILEQLMGAGVQISLIGDPNQGIYEFADADGKFLSQYGERHDVTSLQLTRNYRSVPSIIEIANQLSNRSDKPGHTIPKTGYGAFFIPYKNNEHDSLLQAFQSAVITADLKIENSAVLCRGRDLVNQLTGNGSPAGQGTVEIFAQAVIARDKSQDYINAFKKVVICISRLLEDMPKEWVATITQPAHHPEAKLLRRLIWRFTRNSDTGLPSARLQAFTEWHPLLLTRIKALLEILEKEYGLSSVDNISRKLAKTELPNASIVAVADLTASNAIKIRVDTVHQAKGESLDAVLYMATKKHVTSMLDGVASEDGRIGYVAVTRARNFLWLAIPANSLSELRPKLLEYGFQEINL